MSSGEFKLQRAVFPVLENFDFKADCTIEEFKMVRVPKRDDAIVSFNKGGRYSPESKALAERARPGDKYYFENIKCKCPGDVRLRDLGIMVFRIN